MVKTINQAVKYLESYIPLPSKKHPGELGLERMRYLMELLGNPQLKYPTIHVGGTAGKGSTATIIASILATKYKVGLHTSPHLVKINERIRICGSRYPRYFAEVGVSFFRTSQVRSTRPSPRDSWCSRTSGRAQKDNTSPQNNGIPNKEFIVLVDYIKPFVEKVEKSKFGAPTYFEIVTAMAFLYFYMQKVDIAVIEVGMGGRYDATNVIKPLVAVITNVGLDHTEILGDTVEKIAKDKVGIIKSGIQVVTGAKQPSVINIIKTTSNKQQAEISILGKDFSYRIKEMLDQGSVFDYYGKNNFKDLRLSLLGKFQIENAALAVRVIELLNESAEIGHDFFPHLPADSGLFKKGLNSAFIPGRLEVIRRKPLVVLDGAHNPDKVKALATSIKKIFPGKRVTAIIAIKNDKNAEEMLTALVGLSHKIIFTKFQLTADLGIINSYDPKSLLEMGKILDGGKPMVVIENAQKALNQTIKTAKKDDLILVTGSLYLVGEIKKVVGS